MNYICTTCGAVAESPGHLCSPCDDASGFGCPKPRKDDEGHACRDHALPTLFSCATCGRVTEERQHLCNPAPMQK